MCVELSNKFPKVRWEVGKSVYCHKPQVRFNNDQISGNKKVLCTNILCVTLAQGVVN